MSILRTATGKVAFGIGHYDDTNGMTIYDWNLVKTSAIDRTATVIKGGRTLTLAIGKIDPKTEDAVEVGVRLMHSSNLLSFELTEAKDTEVMGSVESYEELITLLNDN